MNVKIACLACLLAGLSPAVAQETQPDPAAASQPASADGAAATAAAEPVPEGVDPEQEGLTILFDLGTASIRSDQAEILDQASRLYRDGNPVVMIITGTADTVGAASENLDLSIARARRVADGLVARGIPIERLQVLGRGNSELPVPTPNGVANEENRSVKINWR